MSLKEKGMIANLTISKWTARKYDKNATREVETAHNAHEAGRFNKVLLQSSTLDQITSIDGKIRGFHYESTLPWGDNGDRLLPTVTYFEYISELGKLQYEHNQLVDKFIEEYNDEIQRSEQRLNTLFNREDYPHESEVRNKFRVHVSFMPIADSDDLRVSLNDEIIEAMREQITSEVNVRLERTKDDMIDRLYKAVSHMVEKLEDREGKFRDTLVGNIETLVETLPLLNFMNDPHVNNAINACKPLIVNPYTLRDDRFFRQEICERAKKVLKVLK
jgi:hypothetical protein